MAKGFFFLVLIAASVCQVICNDCGGQSGHRCHKWAQCERRQGDPQPRCYCSPGYQGDGVNCNRRFDNERDCPPPNQIRNGEYSPRRGSYPTGFVITYRCYQGTLMGNAQRTCYGGQWSGAQPRCDNPDECQRINHQTCHANADCTRMGENYYQCKCKDGFKGDGVYCEDKSCKRPPDIANGELLTQQQNFVRGNIVTYRCKRGYKLQGSSQISCKDNGQWTQSEPRCEKLQEKPVKKSCPYPRGIANGELKLSDGSRGPGSVATYNCRQGYRIEGNSQRTCQNDGTWSGRDPRCQRSRRGSRARKCNRPQDIAHGYFRTSDQNYKPRTVVTYQCRGSYRLVGQNQITCLPNGEWNGRIPKCEGSDDGTSIRCQRPPENIAHGNIAISDQRLVVGTVVTFTCNNGYRLDGDSQRTCQGDRRWSGRQPQCRRR